jgi:ribose transport system substrate-binding protein
MNKALKILLISVLIVLVSLAVLGCKAVAADKDAAAGETAAGQGESGGTLEKVGYSPYLASHLFWIEIENGIKEVGAAKGFTVSVQDPNLDAAKQQQQIEAFINSDIQGIICATIDAASLNPTIKKAVEKGIGFISVTVPADDATANVLISEYEYGLAIGTLAGQWAQKNYPGEKIEAAMLRAQDYLPGIERAKGMKEAFLKEFPTGEVVVDQHSNSIELALEATAVVLQAHPDVKIFLCDSDDTGAIGAYEALKERIDEADWPKYGVFGADAVEQAIKYVKEGGMYRGTVDLKPKQIGVESAQLLLDWAAGKKIEGISYSNFRMVDYETAMKDY